MNKLLTFTAWLLDYHCCEASKAAPGQGDCASQITVRVVIPGIETPCKIAVKTLKVNYGNVLS